MDKIITKEGSSGADVTDTNIADRPMREQQQAIYSQLRLINESINKLRVKLEEGEVLNHHRFEMLNKNIQRIIMPVQSSLNTTIAQEPNFDRVTKQSATLSSTPRTLNVLWEEYTKGLGGSKAAKDFSAKERGAVKYKYSRRKVFWDCVTKLINSGLSADVAIEQIYIVYGKRNTVTKILNEMSKDRRSGKIPHLIRR